MTDKEISTLARKLAARIIPTTVYGYKTERLKLEVTLRYALKNIWNRK